MIASVHRSASRFFISAWTPTPNAMAATKAVSAKRIEGRRNSVLKGCLTLLTQHARTRQSSLPRCSPRSARSEGRRNNAAILLLTAASVEGDMHRGLLSILSTTQYNGVIAITLFLQNDATDFARLRERRLTFANQKRRQLGRL